MDYEKAQRGLAPLLKPASLLYGGLMKARASAYARGLFSSKKTRAFTVSVGNIAWGGSGKTPLVDWLLSWAENRGLRPAVLTRGYGGKSETRPLQVRPFTAVEQSGDEALMLSRAHPKAFIMADPVRSRSVEWLENNSTADMYILDDGMQHLAVRRDLDLVLLRRKDLADQWNRVIPAGSWREPDTALHRADAFLLRAPAEDLAPSSETAMLAAKRLSDLGKPVFGFDLSPAGLRKLQAPNMADEPNEPDSSSQTQAHQAHQELDWPYAMCTAVGSPESVRASLTGFMGTAPEREVTFPDHHLFSEEDILELRKLRLPVIVTAKDAVKIEPLLTRVRNIDVYALEAELAFGPRMFSNLDFAAWLDARAGDFV